MSRFPMIVFAVGLPLLLFLALNDGVSTLYQNLGPKPGELAYVVAEPEEEAEVEEVAVEEEAPAEEAAEAAPVEEAVTEEVSEQAAAEEDVAEAAPAVEQEASVADAPAAIDLSAASRLMRRCTACHQLERDRNGVGPHLLGVVGRQIGGVDGYKYSDALMALNEEGQIWTEDALVAWLENPAGFAPGTKMNFKVRAEEDRRLIAAWLAQNEG